MSEFWKILSYMFKSPEIYIMLFVFISTNILSKYFFNNSKKSKEKLFKLLDQKFNKGLINEKEDISLLVNAVAREFDSEYSISSTLEDYLAYLLEKEKVESELLIKYYDLIKSIIHNENEEKPFVNIPEEERRLLRSIEDSVKHGDNDSIIFNLEELSTVIAARNKIYQRADKLNRWSIPIAVIGILLTIIFGIISLYPSFDYKKIEQINKNLVKEINADSLKIK